MAIITIKNVLEHAEQFEQMPELGTIPLDVGVVDGGDSGEPVARFAPDGAAGSALRATAQRVIDLVPPVEDETCTARIARLVDALEAQPA